MLVSSAAGSANWITHSSAVECDAGSHMQSKQCIQGRQSATSWHGACDVMRGRVTLTGGTTSIPAAPRPVRLVSEARLRDGRIPSRLP